MAFNVSRFAISFSFATRECTSSLTRSMTNLTHHQISCQTTKSQVNKSIAEELNGFHKALNKVGGPGGILKDVRNLSNRRISMPISRRDSTTLKTSFAHCNKRPLSRRRIIYEKQCIRYGRNKHSDYDFAYTRHETEASTGFLVWSTAFSEILNPLSCAPGK